MHEEYKTCVKGVFLAVLNFFPPKYLYAVAS